MPGKIMMVNFLGSKVTNKGSKQLGWEFPDMI